MSVTVVISLERRLLTVGVAELGDIAAAAGRSEVGRARIRHQIPLMPQMESRTPQEPAPASLYDDSLNNGIVDNVISAGGS